MIFGDPADFAIEAYHEPSGPEWGGFGRMAIHIQGVQIGDIFKNHCSLFAATDQFRRLYPVIEAQWERSFTGLPDLKIFEALNEALYTGAESGWHSYGHFDFLTNAGEQFDGHKTFIVCRSGARVSILYDFRDGTFGSGSCGCQAFCKAAESFVHWFDKQARAIAPPFFPINPFDPNETDILR